MDAAQPSRPAASRPSSLAGFAASLIVLVALRILIGFLPVPSGYVWITSLIVSVLFVAIPILGYFAGASFKWTWKSTVMCIVVGATLQVSLLMLGANIEAPLLKGLVLAISQSGLLLWCFGLGAALANLLKDRNLLLPVSIFLALFDVWLVFAPGGVAKQATSGVPNVQSRLLKDLALQVPQPVSHSAGGFAQALAYIGPADLLFIAMFFVALFKFGMRTRETLLWLIPTLGAYLLIVLLVPYVTIGPFALGALPALLPIGAVVLIVNRREFSLSRDEKASTLVILLGGLAILVWIFTHLPESQPELSRREPARAAAVSPDLPRRGVTGRYPLVSQMPPADKPNLP
jgi:hypothetical protein